MWRLKDNGRHVRNIYITFLTAIYRGCFDGWIDTDVEYNYNGCYEQQVSGTMARLCLCDTTLCNAHAVSGFGELRVTAARRPSGHNKYGRMSKYAKEGAGGGGKGGDEEWFGLAETQPRTTSYRYGMTSLTLALAT